MNKNLYSLMLSDGVVAEVDKLAYQQGTNRSNMINQILAEYVSYVTPEKRIQEIFDKVEALLGEVDTFQMALGNSNTILNMRSPLAFKYNPNVKYSVELYRSPGRSFGELRVSLRTQNNSLLLYMMQFFKLWAKIESSYLSGCEYSIADGKFRRRLTLRAPEARLESMSSEELGRLVSEYIQVFDEALKAFFYNLNSPGEAVREVEKIYLNYHRTARELI